MDPLELKIVVACINAEDEPDLLAVKVKARVSQVAFGDHLKEAKTICRRHGCDPTDAIFVEGDKAFSVFEEGFIDWDTVEPKDITKDYQ